MEIGDSVRIYEASIDRSEGLTAGGLRREIARTVEYFVATNNTSDATVCASGNGVDVHTVGHVISGSVSEINVEKLLSHSGVKVILNEVECY
jgi:hypothetical protein